MKLYRFLLISFLFISISSCKNSYEREYILETYIKKNPNKFDNTEFYLLVLRMKNSYCGSQGCSIQDKDFILQHVRDSLINENIFVITDGTKYFINAFSINNCQNITFILENKDTLDKYGFYHHPYLFHIKEKSLIDWKKMCY